MGIPRLAKQPPERDTCKAISGMKRGIPFGRPLTLAERLCLGMVAAKPTRSRMVPKLGEQMMKGVTNGR